MAMQHGEQTVIQGLFGTFRRLDETFRSLAGAWQNGVRPGLYDPAFQSHLRIGDTVHVLKDSGEVNVRIDAVEPLPYRRNDVGSLTSASSLANDITVLDMPNGELAVYRFVPTTPIEVELNHPSGSSQRWRTSTTNFRIPPWLDDPALPQGMRDYYWAASQFWVYEAETPRFDIYRLAAHDTEMHLDFSGWRYQFTELPVNQRGALNIRMNGWQRKAG